MLSPDGSRIRCPKDEWRTSVEDRRVCKCTDVWNTFLTGGLCPRASNSGRPRGATTVEGWLRMLIDMYVVERRCSTAEVDVAYSGYG